MTSRSGSDGPGQEPGGAERVVLADEPPARMGPLLVEPSRRRVSHDDGGSVVLDPRAMKVLAALLRVPGSVLSRDRLFETSWEGRAVSDDAVDRAVARARRALREVAHGLIEIETVTKVGYRLIVDAQPNVASHHEPVEPGTAVSQDSGSPAAAGPGISRRLLIAGGVVAVTTAAGSWWLLRGRTGDVPAPAREAFEQGRRLFDSERFEESTAAFQRAADAAPGFDDAWGWIALSIARERYMQPQRSGDRIDARIREATERALALDPRNAAALTAQAMGVPIYGDWLNAEAALRRVLQIDPQMSPARDLLAWVLENVGRWRDSIDLLRPYAAQFENLKHVQSRLVISLWSSGRIADADRAVDAAMRRWPDSFWFSRFYLYARTGRAAQALAMSAARPRSARDGDFFELAELCARALLTREPADIERAMAEHRGRAAAGSGFCENAIQLAAEVGRLDEAFHLCGAYYFGRGFRVAPTRFAQPNEPYTASYLRRTAFLFMPNLDPLRRDPRFANLIEEVGLASYWRRSGTHSDVMA